VEKISEIFTMWIARYEFLNSKKSFFRPYKKPGRYFLQAHMKKYPK